MWQTSRQKARHPKINKQRLTVLFIPSKLQSAALLEYDGHLPRLFGCSTKCLLLDTSHLLASTAEL
jgi:hypothetical protein